MKKNLLSIFALAVLMLVSVIGRAQTTYTRVNSASELEASAQYILVGFDNDGNAYAMSYQKPNNRHALAVSEDGGTVTTVVATDPNSQVDPFEFTLMIYDGSYVIYDQLNSGYLCAPGGGNYLRTQTDINDNCKWTITDGEEGGMVPVAAASVEQNIMRYNITSTLFGCYKSSSNVSATVYFYKAGGAPVIYPEPSNYPTHFTATVDGGDVTLTWNDATGSQLPSKYLVLASPNTITVPQDGTPVANSEWAKNVSYGAQTVTFVGLGRSTYCFAIFPYTNSGENIDYKTDGTYPKTWATTLDYFLFEDFNEELGQFTQYSVLGDQVWHQGSYQGKTYANMNGFVSQGVYDANEDWLISPELQLGANNVKSLILEFSTAAKFDGNPLQVMVSTNYSGQGDPNAATWADITDAFDYSTGNYEWVESGTYDLLGILNGSNSFHVAFLYTCTTEGATSWEIDYVKILAEYEVSVNETAAKTFGVYPNPANSVISFNLDSDAQVSVFDVTGRMVSTMNMAAGQGQCQVGELENGVYFLNVRYANGKQEVARFVKF